MKLEVILGDREEQFEASDKPPMWCYVEETYRVHPDKDGKSLMHKRYYVENRITCKDYNTPTELGKAMANPRLNPKSHTLTHRVSPTVMGKDMAMVDDGKVLIPSQYNGGPIKYYRSLNATEKMELRVELGRRGLL